MYTPLHPVWGVKGYILHGHVKPKMNIIKAFSFTPCIFSLFLFPGLWKKDGSEYEPDTLTSIQNSIDRHIKSLKLQYCIKTDAVFSHSRRVLESKRKSLKAMGKGNKAGKAEALSEEEIQILYQKNVLGTGMYVHIAQPCYNMVVGVQNIDCVI